MARGKGKSGRSAYTSDLSLSQPTTLEGMLSPNTLTSLPTLTTEALVPSALERQSLEPQSDRRRYNPDNTFARAHATIREATQLVDAVDPGRLAFAIPRYVAICIRRKVRREVLHAFDLTDRRRRGKGGGRHKPRKRNEYSSIKC